MAKLPASCVVYVDDSLELPPTPARVRPLALQSIRREVGPLGVATAALGAFLQETGAYPVEALARAMKTFQSHEDLPEIGHRRERRQGPEPGRRANRPRSPGAGSVIAPLIT
jgi:hypothetical protein